MFEPYKPPTPNPHPLTIAMIVIFGVIVALFIMQSTADSCIPYTGAQCGSEP